MGEVYFKTRDKEVATIAARNALTKVSNGMTVKVIDASADVEVTLGGWALYKYINNAWVLMKTERTASVSSTTEVKQIVNSQVAANNIPMDDNIFDVYIMDMSEPSNPMVKSVLKNLPDRTADYVVSNGVISISNAEFNGHFLSYSYLHGTISQQLNSVLAAKFDKTGGIISGSIIPDVDEAYDLGSPTKKFKELHLSGNTIFLGSIALKTNSNGTFGIINPETNQAVSIAAEDNGDIVNYLTEADITQAMRDKINYLSVTGNVDLDNMKSRLEQLAAAVVLVGEWSGVGGVLPTSTKAGQSWIVTTDVTVGGVEFNAGDRVIALVDNASTTTVTDNWHKADYTDKVGSVNGKIGTVVIDKEDVGLGNVDNTADLDKPISLAVQAELDAIVSIGTY